MANTKPQKGGHRPDYFLVALIGLLTVAGLTILVSASSELGKAKFDDGFYYLKHQLLNGGILGIAAFFICSRLHYQYYRKFALIMLAANIFLLALVFSPLGVSGGGASRWVHLGPVLFQPSELLKITFIIYIAAWLTNPKIKRGEGFLDGFMPFLIICGVVGGMLVFQPATSTVAILLIASVAMYFIGGVKMKYLLAVGAVGIAAFGLLVWSTPYRLQRVMSFMNPGSDRLNTGYQQDQARIAIGSGGMWGVGYGQSTSKINSLPTPADDSIFAVAAQELGFIGGSMLVILFGIFVFRLFWLAGKMRDRFGQLMLVGFASIVGLQSIFNIGSISGFLPLTGVPLPFISYGGTALAVFLALGGISVNISRYT